MPHLVAVNSAKSCMPSPQLMERHDVYWQVGARPEQCDNNWPEGGLMQ